MCVPGRAAHITTGLDAQTPGVRTTRLLRPRTSPLAILDGWRALAIEAEPGRCQRRVVPRKPPLTVSRPAANLTRRRRRGHRIPTYVRDDRETPLVAGRDGEGCTAKQNFCKCESFEERQLTQR